MDLLLDTHAFLWWLDGDRRLSKAVRQFIEQRQGDVFVSAATAWEVTTKVRIGKLPGAVEVASDFLDALASQEFIGLDVTVAHAHRAGSMAGRVRDPFDRMLIAQAAIEDMALASNERTFDAYGVRRLW